MTKPYTLPDGTRITLGRERYRAAELLFDPAMALREEESLQNSVLDCKSSLFWVPLFFVWRKIIAGKNKSLEALYFLFCVLHGVFIYCYHRSLTLFFFFFRGVK